MISTAELIAATGATQSEASVLESLERAAVEFLQNYTGRYFGPPDLVQEFVSGKGTRFLWLRDHVTAPGGDSDDYSEVFVERSGTVLLQDTDFTLRVFDRENALVHVSAWTQGAEYDVTYWRGYPEGEEPADIRQAVIDIVRYRYQASQVGGGLKSETIGEHSYTLDTSSASDMMTAVPGLRDTLAQWKRPVYA